MGRPARKGRVASLHGESYAAFVRLLVERRKVSGLSQQDVADALRWPQSFIAKIEKQQRRIDAVELIRLAAAVGFDPSKIVRDLQKLMIELGEIDK
ncbi:MAG: helix-turn-helix transcriptional regulator [Vitreimonas sp.]